MRIPLRKKIIIVLLLLVAWLSVIITGTNALLSDQALLTGNSVVTGSTDLQISATQTGDSEPFYDTRPGFNFNFIPGASAERYFYLKNAGPADVPLAISVKTAIQGAVPLIADSIKIEIEALDATLRVITSTTGTVRSLSSTGQTLSNLVITKGSVQRFRLRTSLSADFAQFDMVTYDVVLTGTQVIPSV